ncbi:MAG: tripartite tricarboxylate transporter TctB family protein [Motiliproteus sp.]
MREIRIQDVLIGGSVVALALIGILVIIPSGIVSPGAVEIEALSPAFWPQVVLIGLAIAGGIILFQGFFPSATDCQDDDISEPTLALPVVIAKLIIAVTVLFSFYYAIDYVGIVLSSIVTLIILMLLGGERRPILLSLVAVILPVLLFYFFTYVANVPLPLGLFES